jgi:hypothetical protein
MIWLTWRQHRKQALFAVIGLAVLAAVLIPTGLQLYDGLAEYGLRDCARTIGEAQLVPLSATDTCEQAVEAFYNRYATSHLIIAVLLTVLPMLAGMVWGATLTAREVEHGTHRFVWTQGVTRLRWLLVKVGLVAGGGTLVAIAFTVLMSWWLWPLGSTTVSRLEFPFFDLSGLAPAAYTLFAVALGVLAGAVSRKVLPAMAITLVGFVAVRAALTVGVRPRFQAPREVQFPVATETVPNEFRGDWILSQDVYDANGVREGGGLALCNGPDCEPGRYNLWTYQPADRFWLFQYLEVGILVGLSALLILVAIYLVRRRIS